MSPSTTGPTSIRKVSSSKGAWPSRTIRATASGPRTSSEAAPSARAWWTTKSSVTISAATDRSPFHSSSIQRR